VSAGDALRALLERCCAARRWVDAMAASAPWRDREELLRASEAAFDTLERADWLEAFAGHPRIGDLAALRDRFDTAGDPPARDPSALDLAVHEQAAAAAASEATLRALAEGNARYDERFGHLFLVFATGKSADEMLGLLAARLGNEPAHELRIAGEEQRRITRKRLSGAAPRILAAGGSPGEDVQVSAITTHVLDTMRGIPAAGVEVHLQRRDGSELYEIGRGRTDENGRLDDLSSDVLVPGVYRLVFGVGDYFADLDVDPFFPAVTVEFHFDDARGHVHVPLLLSPYGYSTYRGS
jgi:5-hydroxyisourate hydrolase/2-oxo-4-hydroxy-4-carboxy-5-ureidoimidazoline decarboxylase